MKAALTLAFAAMATATLFASSGPPIDVGTRAKGAEQIVVGKVLNVSSRFDTSPWGDQLIVSDVTVQVEETLKGNPNATALVTLEGGSVGDLTLNVSDMPSVEKDDRAVLFLKQTPAGGHVPWGRGYGVLMLDSTNHVVGSDVTLDDVKASVRSAR